MQWITTAVVAKGKIVHAGLTQARAMVRNKAGKKVEFGVSYLLSRLGGAYVFGTLMRAVVDESKMPMQALAGYRAIFGPQATPTLVVYDAHNCHGRLMLARSTLGVTRLTFSPKARGLGALPRPSARRSGASAQARRDIGTLKTDKYGFNKPKERLWQTLEMAGPRSILSFNLNMFMRYLVRPINEGTRNRIIKNCKSELPYRVKRQAKRPPLHSKSLCDTHYVGCQKFCHRFIALAKMSQRVLQLSADVRAGSDQAGIDTRLGRTCRSIRWLDWIRPTLSYAATDDPSR